MPWFKIDDGFHGHPKVMNLSPSDVGVWTLAGTWCANYLTDGEITLPAVRRLGGTQENCQALVDAGLWMDEGGGTYRFKDWTDYQPSKVEVEAERAEARERMRALRAKRKGTKPEPATDVQTNTGERSAEVRSTPAQPCPAQPSPAPQRGGESAPKRATRLPDGWTPSQSVYDAMAAESPAVDLDSEHRKFTDHWKAQPGAKGVKLDWDATWRNWIRRAAEYAAPRGYSTPDQRRAENVHRISQHNPWTPDQTTPDQWGEGVRALGR